MSMSRIRPGRRAAALALCLGLTACTQWQYELGEPLAAAAREELPRGTPRAIGQETLELE